MNDNDDDDRIWEGLVRNALILLDLWTKTCNNKTN